MISKFRGKYGFLSSMYHSPLVYEDIEYPTAEHGYQAAKTLDQKEKRRIANLPSPVEAKKAGRKALHRSDWEEVKLQVMYDIVRAKFTSNLAESPRL